MKTCTKCGGVFPATVEYFYRQRVNYDGLQNWCKVCRKKYDTDYRDNDEYRAGLKRYCDTNKGRVKEYRESKRNPLHKYWRQRYLSGERQRSDTILKRMYGIGIEEYDTMFYNQGGHCAICGKHQLKLKRRLDVDHDHVTGKVRGLLCNRCNIALGNFDEDVTKLQSALMYLRK